MKQLLLLSAILLTSIYSFAAEKGALRIRMDDNRAISVSIDGKVYRQEKSVITIGNVLPGRHLIQVFETRGRSARKVPVYQGYVRVRPGMLYVVVVDRATETAKISSRRLPDRFDEDDYIERDDRTAHHQIYNNDPYILTGKDMSDLHERVNDRITDSDKMKLMKSVLSEKSYTTEQVKEMLGWLSFESTKLEFAKWAFDNVTDRSNYWKIESEFSFSSSKDEFNDYITGK